jgi:N-ethylmaleimide reductase
VASPDLFSPIRLGDIEAPNRIVMAPLTRSRAVAGNVPNPLAVTYYTQRASAGLIISEATQICPEGQGYPNTPGIHTPEQIAGWRAVTDAVHAAGGRIVCQLWHVGRISHAAYQPEGRAPVAPSAIAARGEVYTPQGMVPLPTPRALETEEIPGLVAAYVAAAKNAREAGFDGVEVHGANGYLLDQFLRDGTNQRTDAYGGSIENRARLLLAVVDAVVGVWGSGRVGVRLSPINPFNDIADSTPQATFEHVAKALSSRNLAYLHVIELGDGTPFDFAALRRAYQSTYIAAGGFDRERAQAAVTSRAADAIAFGKLFIANPDLPARLMKNAPLNAWDEATFYGGDARGYTDYPALG